ncbi:lactadherin-like [Branchiostoma lanceolatum]|uniref:lactadherin-like n=1 Tax=Branchiostoma lanceolatum TaxID=7740 RepID=UPI003454AE02
MESGAIPDDHITASAEEPGYEAWRGRLNNGKAWQTNTADTDQWLQIDLGSQKVLTGIQTQGLWGGHTKSYKLMFSDDASTWVTYGDGQDDTIFDGNSDGPTIVEQTLSTPVSTQYVRINPQSWQGTQYIRLRVELLGCDGEYAYVYMS